MSSARPFLAAINAWDASTSVQTRNKARTQRNYAAKGEIKTKKIAIAPDSRKHTFSASSFASAAVKSASSISSSAVPSRATPAPSNVSSSARGLIPRGPGRYTSRCRCTDSFRSTANTRFFTLSIVSAADASSMAVEAPVIATTDMRLPGMDVKCREGNDKEESKQIYTSKANWSC
jgi:hypothetical protein